MRYYSTNGSEISVDLCEAVTRSFAADGGVYMPLSIPVIPRALFNNISGMSVTDIGYVVGSSLFGSDLDLALINDIVKETFSFDIPLKRITDHVYALELFHGPTKTFKDVGARFMARIINCFIGSERLKPGPINMLVATQGDTGYAVARAFENMPGVKVFIFHPSKDSVKLPEHMRHPVADNVISVEIRGTLDDCQELVRRAYIDPDLNRKLNLTSANSINIARLLPQTFFYFYAYSKLKALGEEMSEFVAAMPCGNLGNLTAALFAKQMGVPIRRIIAAGRGEQRLWGEMQNGRLSVSNRGQRALNTNLSRINALITRNPDLAENLVCNTYSPEEVDRTIKLFHDSFGYVLGRNSALAAKSMLDNRSGDEVGVFLATDHPDMYADHLNSLIGLQLSSRKTSAQYRDRHIPLSPSLPAVKNFILEHSC